MPLKEKHMEMILEAGSFIETFDRSVRISTLKAPIVRAPASTRRSGYHGPDVRTQREGFLVIALGLTCLSKNDVYLKS